MPVTVRISDVDRTACWFVRATSAGELLKQSCEQEYENCKDILQSSFAGNTFTEQEIVPSKNGFVFSLVYGYSYHHHVNIRPDDVWCAIISQLGFYVNAHAKAMRSYFVAHKGKKALEVIEAGTLQTTDLGAMAVQMTQMMQKHVRDPDLREWVMPAFTTTTPLDRVVAAVLMMATLQAYFSFAFTMTCGLPSVTLLGERQDWQAIDDRLGKLSEMGTEPAKFAELLKPILKRFLATFDDPSSPDVQSFWARAVDRQEGSGMDYCSGWVTAFCFWDVKGKISSQRHALELDGVQYPVVDMDNAASGFAGVPVTINDNGDIIPARMVAGSVGIRCTTTRGEKNVEEVSVASSQQHQNLVEMPAIEPVMGWWVFSTGGTRRWEIDE